MSDESLGSESPFPTLFDNPAHVAEQLMVFAKDAVALSPTRSTGSSLPSGGSCVPMCERLLVAPSGP